LDPIDKSLRILPEELQSLVHPGDPSERPRVLLEELGVMWRDSLFADYLAQLNSASCLNLLIAMISVSNALEYQRVWQAEGGPELVPVSYLKTLSTFSTDGVIYLGKYFFARDGRQPGPMRHAETA
jgi:hypothetical protein